MEQEHLAEISQPLQSESLDSQPETEAVKETTDSDNESLDDKIAKEQAEIAEIDKVEAEPEESSEEEPEESEEEEEGYKPNSKYKVLDEEHEFNPKLQKILNEETEPIIRELYEKAHGIEAIKASRTAVTRERDELRSNYTNLIGEVGRAMNYKRAGDLQSFFEAVQIDDNTIAKYIMEKARISQLPPEQQAIYNERESLRRRLNGLEQNFHSLQTQGVDQEVHARLSELDQVIGSDKISQIAKDFDARNGKGSFREAVMYHGSHKWEISKQDMNPADAVASFIKTNGLSAKSQPKPGADVIKRVVARPKVKTIPNYGGGQASVTATKKPTSVADLRKLAAEFNR